MIALRLAGSTRPPRANRAYFRIASWSLISTLACSSTLSGRSPAGGNSKAEAERPQSSALLISLMASCALAENPMLVIHTGGPLRSA